MNEIKTWADLVGIKSDKGEKSFPNNPNCKVSSASCSKDMQNSDLCFWHYWRMEKEPLIEKCGCRKEWKCAIGDSTSRNLYRTYFPDVKAVIAYDGFFCCGSCQNANSETYMCGDMKVCENCMEDHSIAYLDRIKKEGDDDEGEKEEGENEEEEEEKEEKEEEEEEEKEEWPFLEKYEQALIRRDDEGLITFYGSTNKKGPLIYTSTSPLIETTVNSVSKALVMAGKAFCENERDYWLWLAGWYTDCPSSLPCWIR